MRHEHFSRRHPSYSCYFLQLLIVVPFISVFYIETLYTLLMPVYCTFKFQIVTFFVYLTLAYFLRYPIVTVFNCNVSSYHVVSLKPYSEEERPCLLKYWKGKIYFPYREISRCSLYYLFFNLLLLRSFTTGSGTFILSRHELLVAVVLVSTVIDLH